MVRPGVSLPPKYQQFNNACDVDKINNCNGPACTMRITEKCIQKNPGISAIIFELGSEPQAFEEFKENRKKVDSSLREMGDQFYGTMCKDFIGTPEYKNGNTTQLGYKICCEFYDYCSFYVQTWFYIVCGVVGLLLLVGIAGAVFFFYRKRKRMGK